MELAEVQAMAAELDPVVVPIIIWEWNSYMENTVLPLAKAKCPRSPPNRESRIVGTQDRKYPKRLADTIYIRYNNGVANLMSDDERMMWLELGTRPHAINAKVGMSGLKDDGTYGGLMWRTPGGQLITGHYGVLHPGKDPQPILFPAIWEAAQAFGPILGNALRGPIRPILERYGITI
jgi:hypothetical protein